MKRLLRRFAESVFLSPVVRRRIVLIGALAALVVVWRWDQSRDVQRNRPEAPRPEALLGTNAVPATPAHRPATVAGALSANQALTNVPAAQPPTAGNTHSPSPAANAPVPVTLAAAPAAPANPIAATTAYPEDIGIDLSSEEARARTVERIKAAEDANLKLALETARAKGWPTNMLMEGGRRMELTGIRKDGSPIYQGADNALAAVTANVFPLRTASYVPAGLRGEGWKVGVWEPGRPVFTHPLFDDRVHSGDGNTANLDIHATHVIGTIASSGAGNGRDARGMAPAVQVDAYSAANDDSEMLSVAATDGTLRTNRIFISNHSYGVPLGWDYGKAKSDNTNGEPVWIGMPGDSRDRNAGIYNADASSFDTVVYEAAYYLPFKSAGNERGGALRNGATFFWRYDSNYNWVKITNLVAAPGPDGGRPGGYETVTAYANAKNIMTIGSASDAVYKPKPQPGGVDIIDNEDDYLKGYLRRDVPTAKPSSFSAWGPTDDGRIKPDLMANGEGLLSSSHKANGDTVIIGPCCPGGDPVTETLTGTSMASPSAAGTAILLQQYHHTLFGTAMRASLLKALLLHTADNLDAEGPDYRTGWGLLNAETAANLLKRAKDFPNNLHLYESYLADADPNNPAFTETRESQTLTFDWTGPEPLLKATLVWTDPPGTPTTNENRTPRLVNDLDLRLITPAGETIYPWVLNPERPGDGATRGDNVLDNVEQIFAFAPAPGRYTLVISRKSGIRQYDAVGQVSGQPLLPYGRQVFSLMLSGNGPVTRFEEGLDNDLNGWNANGDAPWRLGTDNPLRDGKYAFCRLNQSPQASYFEKSVEGPQQVSWWWTITGPTNMGASPIFFVTVNGREVVRLDRPTPWHPYILDLGPGRYKIRWNYVAERGVDASAFAAGVDLIEIGPPVVQTPFGGRPVEATTRIEAENFDVGVPGQSYVDSDDANVWGNYRTSEGVDIGQSADVGGGFDIWSTVDGEWLEYTTMFPRSGLYRLELRVRAWQAGSILRVGNQDMAIPASGGSYQTITRDGFQILDGINPVRLTWVKGGGDLNWFRWIELPWPDRRAFATASNPGALPWDITNIRIQAEDFDTGGESIAYHDTDGANTGGRYRTNETVDIRITDDPTDPGGFNVTQFNPGEWLKYTVEAPEFDSYDVSIRLRPTTAGTVEVNFGGGGNDEVRLSFNAGAQWITLTGTLREVPRSSGHSLKLSFPNGSAEVNWMEFRRSGRGLTKLLYLNRPGAVLNDFYPQPRGKGLYPRGFENFHHPLIPNPILSGRVPTFSIPEDLTNNYGVIVAGYLVPPYTTDYTFHIASDDQGELYLSTDENPANSQLIASEPEWNTSRSYLGTDRRPLINGRRVNVSAPIRLEGGRRYYIEASMKEATVGDHLSAAFSWTMAGNAPFASFPVTEGGPAIGERFGQEDYLKALDANPLYEVRPTWATPASIQYGTPLGSNQLNVVGDQYAWAGTFVYNPPAGTVLPVGTHTLQSVFVPLALYERQYARVTNTTILTVTPAPLVVRADDKQRPAREPNPIFTATFTGLRNGDSPGHLAKAVQFRCAAAPSSAPAPYSIFPYSASGSNYTITFQTGTLTVTPAAQQPYAQSGGSDPTALPVPGRIQAEAFDQGGEGRAYHDFDTANHGGQLRPAEGVDLEVTTDTGGGHNIGWTAAGEWQEFTVDVADSASYNLTLRVAQVGPSGKLRVWMAGQPVTGPIALPDTGGYQNWVNLNQWRIPLSAGLQAMRIEWLEGGANLNWIEWQRIPDDSSRSLAWWLFNGSHEDSIGSRQLVGGRYGLPGPLPALVNDSPAGASGDQSAEFAAGTVAHLPEVDETQPVNLEGSDYTVEAWVKFTRPASGKSILVSSGRPSPGGWSTWIDANGNLGATSYGIVDLFTTANVPNDGQWHHVAFVHRLGVQMSFFVDGQLRQTIAETRGVAPSVNHALHIGYEFFFDTALNPFTGRMDRLRLTSGALVASQLDYPAIHSDADQRGLHRRVYRYTPGLRLDDFYPFPRGKGFIPPGWEPLGPALNQSGIVENFEAPTGVEDFYGQVLFGYVVPTVTGDYTFYLASDDEGELWLSTDENPNNSRLIAHEPEWNAPRDWTNPARRPLVNGRRVNVSAAIHLEAGKYYYVEAATKEGEYGDNLGVTWQRAGTPVPAVNSAPIGGENLRTELLRLESSPTAPRITIRQAGPNVVLSWPVAAGFLLERTGSLTPGATWSNVAFTTFGGTASATINPTTASAAFFRLRQP